MDTRIPDWADFDGPLGAQQTMLPTALFRFHAAPGAAAAVVLNVAVTETTTDGWLTVHHADQERPFASNLNFRARETVPNLVVVPVNELWQAKIYNSGGPVHVVVDMVGWYVTA